MYGNMRRISDSETWITIVKGRMKYVQDLQLETHAAFTETTNQLVVHSLQSN